MRELAHALLALAALALPLALAWLLLRLIRWRAGRRAHTSCRTPARRAD